jgi:Na+/H+ antiporter NhaD/arsenite permease-like protein
VQGLVVALCTLPVVVALYRLGLTADLAHTVSGYVTFMLTIGALYVTAGGVFANADFKATPRVNAAFLLVGSVLASVIGTTGASVILIRPLLRTNRQRQHVRHLVPFFIFAVANAGGLLTPVGDPPLLVGFISGVPFFWTLRLWPIWLLYCLMFAGLLLAIDRRAYVGESEAVKARDDADREPFSIKGKRNLVLIAIVLAAAFLPAVWREAALLGVALLSWCVTPREVHALNQFSFAPITEVALLFVGLFICLVPIEISLGLMANKLPISHSAQLFWSSGLLSALLDNAPTYAAFAALAKGLSQGQPELVAGIAPLKLAAISAGCVVMGATTYIGNGPNLMIRAIAERAGVATPSFLRYAAFAFLTMLPAHLVVTVAFILLEH